MLRGGEASVQSREPLLRIAHAKLPTLVRRRSESGAGEIRVVNPGVQRVALVDIDHRSVGSNRVRQTTAGEMDNNVPYTPFSASCVSVHSRNFCQTWRRPEGSCCTRTVGGSAQLGPALLELLSQVQRPHRRDQHRPVEEPRALQHHLLGGRDEGAVPAQRGAALAAVGPGIVRDRRAVV